MKLCSCITPVEIFPWSLSTPFSSLLSFPLPLPLSAYKSARALGKILCHIFSLPLAHSMGMQIQENRDFSIVDTLFLHTEYNQILMPEPVSLQLNWLKYFCVLY